MTTAWKELVLELLKEIADYSEIVNLMEEVTERASYIAHKHSGVLDALYKSKVSRYLPPYTASMESKFKGIIGST